MAATERRMEEVRERDAAGMRLAVEVARQSAPVATAYCVGAVLAETATGTVWATGYSRELPGNTHAEECCLAKVADDPRLPPPPTTTTTSAAKDGGRRLAAFTMYTTMEPCSRRLSGKTPCATRLCEAGIGRVVVGIREPTTFVADCEGIEILRAAGVQVDVDTRFEAECRALNLHVAPGE